MRLATTSARVSWAATTTSEYSTVLLSAWRKTGSSASVTKFAIPTHSLLAMRALCSDSPNACRTGTSVKTTNSAKVGRTKRYDQPWRRSAAPTLFVRFVQQLLRVRRHFVQCLLRRLLALEGRVARRAQVLLVDLGPGTHVRQDVREGAHLRDLRLRGVVLAVDPGRGRARRGCEPVLDRRGHLVEVRSDLGTGEVLREDMRRGLLLGIRLLAHGDEADTAPRGLLGLSLREVGDLPVRA